MKIKTILKNIFSVLLALVIAATTFSFNSEKAQAWEQGANGSHEEINKTAVSRFLNASASNPKFANSPIDGNQKFWGNQTISATLNAYEFTMQKSSLTFSQWVTHGGFSADEPEVWACVRHFYDPLAVNGLNELTDHLALHGFVYDTSSAKDWAFKADENPYSWRKALEYYKMSMEIPDDSQISVVKGMDFRDTDITVSSVAEARSVYLGKAFRALGETMHMMADITQPSHVRNDSHPSIDTDPLESTVNKDTVRLVRDAPVLPSIGTAIDSADNLADMYEEIALFTNNSFYTDDTVSDAASGVKQSNHENPYPHPQFSELTFDTKTGVYSKIFNGKPVRMTQETLSSYLLGPLWTDYTVPAAFATEQAEVLVPIAIKANTKVINSFFPTFDLTLDVKQNKDASTNGDANYREYSLGTELKHLSGSDVEWQQQNLAIKYTGPAELWGETKGKTRKIADLKFKNGVPVNPVTIFVGDEKYQKVDKYLVNNGETIYVVVNAGGRKITSPKYTIPASLAQLSITPAKMDGTPDTEYKFTAIPVNPPDKAKYSWTLNGKKVQETYSISYTTRFSAIGNYAIVVKLIDEKGKELASASATADIKAAARTLRIDPPSLQGVPNTSYSFTAIMEPGLANAIYAWSVNGTSVQKGSSEILAKSFPAPGSYEVSVTITDSAGKELGGAMVIAKISAGTPTKAAFGVQNCKYFSWRYRVTVTQSITDPVKSYTESSTVTLGKVNIPITWSGNTFTFSEKGHTLTGTVSADGSTLVKLEETYVGTYTNSVASGSSNSSFALSGVPLGRVQLPINAPSTTGFGIDQTGTSVKSYLSKYESKSTSTTAKGTTSTTISSIEMADKIKLVFSESNISTDY